LIALPSPATTDFGVRTNSLCYLLLRLSILFIKRWRRECGNQQQAPHETNHLKRPGEIMIVRPISPISFRLAAIRDLENFESKRTRTRILV